LLIVSGTYNSRLRVLTLDDVPMSTAMITLATMVTITTNFMLLTLPVTPGQVLRLWSLSVVAVLLGRLAMSPAHRLVLRASVKRRTLVIGSGIAAALVAEKIECHPEVGLEVLGFVDEGPRKTVRGRPEPLLGGLAEMTDIIQGVGAEVVILGFTKNNYMEILSALYRLEPKVEILMMPRYFEFVSAGVKVHELAGMPLLGLNRRLPTLAERFAKRAEDLVIGGFAALLVLPFVPFIALAIKLDSPGPVFFKHERIGKNGRVFQLYKFRSMAEGAHTDEESLEKLRGADPRGLKDRCDVRVTKLGRFLRKSSIDELPQLLNVLTGDMSLVGPRPPVAAEVAAYEDWQKKRLAVQPGITGLWQISGRSDLPFDERIWLDFMYIDAWSPWLDLRILWQTIPAVLSARGAY
jgi:exopolysaccharide biosynthesis polyprenyl glycosylphosphotransferase